MADNEKARSIKWQDYYSAEDSHWQDLRRIFRLFVPIILLLVLSTIATLGYIYLKFGSLTGDPGMDTRTDWQTFQISLILLSPLLVTIAGVLLINFMSTKFIRAFYRPTADTRIPSLIRRKLLGIPPLPLILNAVWKYPLVVIEETRSLERNHWSRWAGGPATLVIYDGTAVYLERGNRFSRVVGPGKPPMPFLEHQETIKAVVDLRPQVKTGKILPWTREGIQVELDVRLECQINASKEAKEKSSNLVYPFDPLEVKKAVEYTAVKFDEEENQLYESDWLNGVWEYVTGYLTEHINKHHIDDIALANLIDLGPTKGNLYSLHLAEKHIEQINADLQKRNCGAHVSNMHIQIKFPPEVNEHRIAFWESGREILAAIQQGRAEGERIRIREKARSKAENDILDIITNRLREAGSNNYAEVLLLSLAGILENLDDPLVRSLIGENSLTLLEKLRGILNAS